MISIKRFVVLILSTGLAFALSGCKNEDVFVAMPSGQVAGTAIGGKLNPNPAPTGAPTVSPTVPAVSPTAAPTGGPTIVATISPTATPTAGPTAGPSPSPTVSPTVSPTPTIAPTAVPTATATPSCKISGSTQELRIVFMVENSGSNSATDKSTSYRKIAIENFMAQNNRSNLKYSFGYFSKDVYQFNMTSSHFDKDKLSGWALSDVVPPFGDATQAMSALSQFLSIDQVAGGNVANAFVGLKQSVSWEIANQVASQPKGNFIVIFISDGQFVGGVTPTELGGMVDDLIGQTAADSGRLLQMNVIFFGKASNAADLQPIWVNGHGKLIATDDINSETINIDDYIVVPGVSGWSQ